MPTALTHTHSDQSRVALDLHPGSVSVSLSISFSPAFSVHISSLLPSFLPLAWLPTYSKAYSLVINLPLSPLLLRLSLHHHLTLARLPVLTPPSPPFACPFSEALSPTSSISVSLPYALCRHNARRHQDFSFLIHPSSPS